MAASKRKNYVRWFEGAAIALVALDLIVYFAAVRPLQNQNTDTQENYLAVLARTNLDRQQIAHLKEIKSAMPQATKDLNSFLHDHVPTRRRGFSQAAGLVRMLTEQNGVQLDNVSYKLTSGDKQPLDRLGIDMTVEGQYTDLMRFAHSLETSQDLVLIRNFSFASAQKNAVSLRVAAELYLTP